MSSQTSDRSHQSLDPFGESPETAGALAAVDRLAAADGHPLDRAPVNSQVARLNEDPAGFELTAAHLTKSYRKGQVVIPVLRGVNLHVPAGEMLAVVGQSGSGKSTLLHLLGSLDAPDGGEIHDNHRGVERPPLAVQVR